MEWKVCFMLSHNNLLLQLCRISLKSIKWYQIDRKLQNIRTYLAVTVLINLLIDYIKTSLYKYNYSIFIKSYVFAFVPYLVGFMAHRWITGACCVLGAASRILFANWTSRLLLNSFKYDLFSFKLLPM